MSIARLATISGQVVDQVTQPSADSIVVQFASGTRLVVRRQREGLVAVLEDGATAEQQASRLQPTGRQREYLEFIAKYWARYGVAPSEADIQHHFLVSAPSAHQMVKTLERRGFIRRVREGDGQVAPRSIEVLWDGA